MERVSKFLEKDEFQSVKLDVEFDSDCKSCKPHLDRLKNNDLNQDEVLVLVPDFNCNGFVTHFHLEIHPKSKFQED